MLLLSGDVLHARVLSKGLKAHLYIYPTSGSVMEDFLGYQNCSDEHNIPLYKVFSPGPEAHDIVKAAENVDKVE